MKKFILFVFITVLLFVSSYSLSFANVEHIEIVNPKNNEKFIVDNSSENKKLIMDALKNIDSTKNNIDDLFSYDVYLIKNKKFDRYKLSFDLAEQTAYVTYKGKNYRVNDILAKKLLLNEIFSYTYIDKTMFEAALDYNGDIIELKSNYSWIYKNIEGHFINKNGSSKEEIKTSKEIIIGENDTVDLKFENEPDRKIFKIFLEENLKVTSSNLGDAIKSITNDGKYLIECSAQWFLKENNTYYGSQSILFYAFIDKPANLYIVSRDNYPGNILLVSVENLNHDEVVKLNSKLFDSNAEMISYEDKNIFMVPIDLNTKPGEYEIQAEIQKEESQTNITSKVTIKNKSFKTQYLTVSDELNNSNNDYASINQFIELVKPARSTSVNEKLWQGVFIMPSSGKLTTDFAEIRYVNNQSPTRHSGIDIAAPTGTIVKAPNNGIVVFAMDGLLSTGNTLVIDHGLGLFSSYYHLDQIYLKKGDKVTKGTEIGTIGSTGFSTGPHLHYAVSLYNTYVNPYQLLSGVID